MQDKALLRRPMHWKWLVALGGLVSLVSAVVGLADFFSPKLVERWRESFPAWTADRSGYLTPANAQPPPIPTCSIRGVEQERPKDSVLVVLGSNAFWVTRKGMRRPVLTVNNKHVVELEYSSVGQIKVWAEVANSDGAVLAKIGEDLDWVADRRTSVYRSASHIVVNDAKGDELLYVRYINEKVLQLRGKFFVPGKYGNVVVESTQIRLERPVGIVRMNCAVDDAGFNFSDPDTVQ